MIMERAGASVFEFEGPVFDDTAGPGVPAPVPPIADQSPAGCHKSPTDFPPIALGSLSLKPIT